jgi:phospholipid-binding lipoprotein MlaA
MKPRVPSEIPGEKGKILSRMALATVFALFLGACAGTAKDGGEPDSGSEVSAASTGDGDPLETVNRFTFAFNDAVDTFVLRPVAVTYGFWVPDPAKDSVRNFLRNLRSPVILANDLFQGEMERAEATAVRFAANSTLGVLGLFDVAEDWGYAYHDEDFGQTLGSYGAGEGFYLVLPLIGPSSLRDGTGMVVDVFFDPLTYVAANNDWDYLNPGRAALTAVDARSRNIDTLDDLRRDSLDFYVRARSLYRQLRRNEIANGYIADDLDSPENLEFEFDDEENSN